MDRQRVQEIVYEFLNDRQHLSCHRCEIEYNWDEMFDENDVDALVDKITAEHYAHAPMATTRLGRALAWVKGETGGQVMTPAQQEELEQLRREMDRLTSRAEDALENNKRMVADLRREVEQSQTANERLRREARKAGEEKVAVIRRHNQFISALRPGSILTPIKHQGSWSCDYSFSFYPWVWRDGDDRHIKPPVGYEETRRGMRGEWSEVRKEQATLIRLAQEIGVPGWTVTASAPRLEITRTYANVPAEALGADIEQAEAALAKMYRNYESLAKYDRVFQSIQVSNMGGDDGDDQDS